MAGQRAQIVDFGATDTDGGFVNLRTGDVLSVDAMLCRFDRAELLQVPIGHRHQRLAGRRRSQSPREDHAHRDYCSGTCRRTTTRETAESATPSDTQQISRKPTALW